MVDPRVGPGQRNVFVLGLDDFHLAQFERIRDADRYHFEPLLTPEELLRGQTVWGHEDEPEDYSEQDHAQVPPYPFDEVVERAIATLHAYPGSVDGITGYWDFPISDMIPIIAGRMGLHAPSLASVLKCEHKYWSRLNQQEVIPDVVPGFCMVDPFSQELTRQPPLEYPFWIKPVKSFSSYLGFRIRNHAEFESALERIRNEIHIIGDPFSDLLRRVETPGRIAELGGRACLVEEIIGGAQCTVEGYVADGEVHVHGVISSFRGPNRSSFHRYEYPAQLPRRVQERMINASKKVIEHIGLNWSAFNIEYFYDRRKDRIWLVEINPRISQSHPELFDLVDGAPTTQITVQLAVGEKPTLPYRAGPYAIAAKFMLRSYEDAIVTRIPTEDDVTRVEAAFPGTRVWLEAEEGVQLSAMPRQDSYSYELAAIYLGARNQRELHRRYEQVLEMLDFRLEPVPAQSVNS